MTAKVRLVLSKGLRHVGKNEEVIHSMLGRVQHIWKNFASPGALVFESNANGLPKATKKGNGKLP